MSTSQAQILAVRRLGKSPRPRRGRRRDRREPAAALNQFAQIAADLMKNAPRLDGD